MNTTERLQAQYARKFLLTAVCVAAAAFALRVILLGKTGDYLSWALLVVLVCGYFGWKGGLGLWVLWKQLSQSSMVQDHGPYGTSEYVPPAEATRQVGENSHGRNMWSAP